MGLGHLDDAIQSLRKVVQHQPNNIVAYCHMGRILLHQKKAFEAVRVLEQGLRLQPKHGEAHELIALAWRILGALPLAGYHQSMALHYAKKGQPKIIQHQHTFFVDREKASFAARQGRDVNTSPQMCYYWGEPFPDAPNNLISVPRDQEAFIAYFLSSRLCVPTVVDFDPNDAEECRLAGEAALFLFHWALAQVQETQRLGELCRTVQPTFIPGEPLRVCLYSSRYTTVMQYNIRDLAKTFQAQGCEVLTLIESHDRESLLPHHHLQDQIAFNPHVVVKINRLHDALHPDIVNIIWYQDLTLAILAKKPLPWRKRDIVYSVSKDLDFYLAECAAPPVKRQGFCYKKDIFFDAGREKKRKIVFIGTPYRLRTAHFFPGSEKIISILAELFAAGEALTEEVLERLSNETCHSKKDILWHAWHFVVRDHSTRWLCLLANEMDLEVEVYGPQWELDEIVRPFAKGVLPHGTAIAEVYNEAMYTLVPHPFDLQSQRLMESVACGSIPIIYDCRYRSEKPHWDECCLWYRTKEDMRACLTGNIPTVDARIISQGRSYGDFIKRILTDIRLIMTLS